MLCEPGKGFVRRRAFRCVRCAARYLCEPRWVDLVRRRDADTIAVNDAYGDHRVLDQRRLVHFRSGETRETGVLDVRDCLRLAAGRIERGSRNVERVHDRTPTCTFLKRAGAAPCETCAL